jgi:hypothetical protein
MVVIAAGQAGQRKYGATASCYNKWCDDDHQKLVAIACNWRQERRCCSLN